MSDPTGQTDWQCATDTDGRRHWRLGSSGQLIMENPPGGYQDSCDMTYGALDPEKSAAEADALLQAAHERIQRLREANWPNDFVPLRPLIELQEQ